jgi:predicted RND superfamily exporter protein
MALAMMGGIIAATVLTLTFLPALYALSFGRAGRKRAPEPEPGRDLIVLPPQRRPEAVSAP